ncbi:MAG: hypothetical protein GTO53_04715 [Planctomycetales bacterium]|nr:hypothetical protein [Planctomycetales bacterium]NIM08457.1 hypothetical protein [Planctomycetales bacterium]NIN77062.1 hypothetical protein [Planctomycetales bacterium]NIO34247.1 hypothetical protein [Planctomycetales bacterium]NIO46048.1 hypothetical protein [Planctomycetales bacterium]
MGKRPGKNVPTGSQGGLSERGCSVPRKGLFPAAGTLDSWPLAGYPRRFDTHRRSFGGPPALKIPLTHGPVMLGATSYSLQNIVDNQGVGIAITGMVIVFTALVLVTLFIAILPKLLARLADVLPPEEPHHGPPASGRADDEALAVAIGLALHSQAKQRAS